MKQKDCYEIVMSKAFDVHSRHILLNGTSLPAIASMFSIAKNQNVMTVEKLFCVAFLIALKATPKELNGLLKDMPVQQLAQAIPLILSEDDKYITTELENNASIVKGFLKTDYLCNKKYVDFIKKLCEKAVNNIQANNSAIITPCNILANILCSIEDFPIMQSVFYYCEFPDTNKAWKQNICFQQSQSQEQVDEDLQQLLKQTDDCLRPMAKPKEILEGREDEIVMLQESLLKKRMKNTILIGPAGCGKTSIVEEFARRSPNVTILELLLSASIAGTKYRGEFEARINRILKNVIKYNDTHKNKPAVLFIDEIHTLLGAGGAEGAIDASNILKPYLSRGEITIIGATTINEYEATIKKDAALSRRLCPIKIKVLAKQVILKILDNFADHTIQTDLLEYVIQASEKIANGNQPDAAIELLDRCMARSKRTNQPVDENMINDVIALFDHKKTIGFVANK